MTSTVFFSIMQLKKEVLQMIYKHNNLSDNVLYHDKYYNTYHDDGASLPLCNEHF